MIPRPRILASVLTLSATAFIGLILDEGYTDKAIIPIKNDVPTVGFGSTKDEEGEPIELGDTATPTRALVIASTHIAKNEKAFQESLPGVSLTQGEYDVYLDFVYQFGIGNWRVSSMRKYLLQTKYSDNPGWQYIQACEALLLWKRSGGYDCSTRINGQRNTVCWGVWKRQLERHNKCLEEQ